MPNKSLHWIFTSLRYVKTSEFKRVCKHPDSREEECSVEKTNQTVHHQEMRNIATEIEERIANNHGKCRLYNGIETYIMGIQALEPELAKTFDAYPCGNKC